MGKLTQKLLDRACNISAKHTSMSQLMTVAFRERYGVTHSDVDADWIIDALDYGVGNITLAECDAEMTDAGYPPKLKADSNG